VKFTESGSIDVHASVVEEDATTFTVRTEITDTGIGIKDVAIGSLFTPFTQFDASATKRYRGTGLGLSICKSLAELMGGAISFHPNPKGQGSVFWFTAKLHKIDAANQIDRLSAKFDSSTLSPVPDSLMLVRELGEFCALIILGYLTNHTKRLGSDSFLQKITSLTRKSCW
jgi:osomolarity two-component system sensor histidine kinase TcsA